VPTRDGGARAPVHPQPSRSAPHAPTEPMWSDRANRSRALPDSRDSVILQYRLSFCYNELNHFARVNSVILLDILEILAQSFCMNSAIFATVLNDSTLLQCQLFHVLQCSAIPRCYIALSFSTSTVLNHLHCYSAQPFLLQKELSHSSLLQCSVIFHCKSCAVIATAQSFSTVIVLSHFACLQCSTIPRAKGAQ
jgi:hypothetical protein